MSKFTLFGEEIEFSTASDNYYFLRKTYVKVAENASEVLNEVYQNCSGISDVIERYPNVVLTIVREMAIAPLFEGLLALEIYDVSRENFEEACLDLSSAAKYYDGLVEIYNDILEDEETEHNYRELRKASRSRVIGGGFGVGGALKGMATAGVMNAITGMGHSIANSIGNMRTAAATAKAKNDLYNNELTFEVLDRGLRETIRDIYLLFADFLNEYKQNIGEGIWIDGDCFQEEKADTLFENSSIVNGKEKELLLRALRLCPYHEATLLTIFRKYEKERKNIFDIAKHYEVDLSVAFNVIISEMYNEEAQKSDEKAYEAKKQIREFMADFEIVENLTLDMLERDCLNRFCQAYYELLPGEGENFVESFIKYDALDKNKIEAIRNHMIWELYATYGIQISLQDKEKIVSNFIKKHSKLRYDVIVAKARIIMDGLDIRQSKSLNIFEYSILKSVAQDYESTPVGHASDIINAIRDCMVSDLSKAAYVYDNEIWELFKEYDVGFSDNEKFEILYRIYQKIQEKKDLSSNEIKDRLRTVVEVMISAEGGTRTFREKKKGDDHIKRNLAISARSELKKAGIYGTFEFPFSEINDWGNEKRYEHRDSFLVIHDDGFDDLYKELSGYLKSKNDIADFEDIFLIMTSEVKSKSWVSTFFTTKNIYRLVQSGAVSKTTINNFKQVLPNSVLTTRDGEYFGDVMICKGRDKATVEKIASTINQIVAHMKFLSDERASLIEGLVKYYNYIKDVIDGKDAEEPSFFNTSATKAKSSKKAGTKGSTSGDTKNKNAILMCVSDITTDFIIKSKQYYTSEVYIHVGNGLVEHRKDDIWSGYYKKGEFPVFYIFQLKGRKDGCDFIPSLSITNLNMYISGVESAIPLKDITHIRASNTPKKIEVGTATKNYKISTLLPPEGIAKLALTLSEIVKCVISDRTSELTSDVSEISQGTTETQEINQKNNALSSEEKTITVSRAEFISIIKKHIAEAGLDSRYYAATTEGFEKRINKIQKHFAPFSKDEIPLVIEDYTLFGSAKEGFLLTDKYIYINGVYDKKVKVAVDDIEIIDIYENEFHCHYVTINTSNVRHHISPRNNKTITLKNKELMLLLIACIKVYTIV